MKRQVKIVLISSAIKNKYFPFSTMANVITEISNMNNMISWEGNAASENILSNLSEPNLYLVFSLWALFLSDVDVFWLLFVIRVGLLCLGRKKKCGPQSSAYKFINEAFNCLKKVVFVLPITKLSLCTQAATTLEKPIYFIS